VRVELAPLGVGVSKVGQTVWLESALPTYQVITKEMLEQLDAQECVVVKASGTSAYIQVVNDGNYDGYEHRVNQKTHCCDRFMDTSPVWMTYDAFLKNKERRIRAIDIRKEAKRLFESLSLSELEAFVDTFKK